jgi:predicted nuclease of predicted toxin-antitoxin system
MNLSPRWVEFLRDAGLSAVHWATLGAANARDADIMAFAAERDYIVLTHDLDFSAILAATQGEKPSVVQIRSDDISPDAAGRQVAVALRQVEEELTTGALLTIDLNRARLRLLPLPPKNSGGP